MRKWVDQAQVFQCCRVVSLSLSCRVFLPPFLHGKTWNNDFGIFRPSPETNFVPNLFARLPQAQTLSKIIFKTTQIPKIKQLRKPQSWFKNQQLGPQLCQDKPPDLNDRFPTIVVQISYKISSKILENPFDPMP